MASFFKGLTTFSPVRAVAGLLTGGTGGQAQWNAANNYTNQAKQYLGQNDLLTNRYNGIAGQARANYSTYAPQATQYNQQYLDYLGRPAGSSVEDQAAIAQATRGVTSAYGQNADNIRQTFAERGGTGSGAELAALTNNQIRQAGTIASARNDRAMQNAALNRQNIATRAGYANQLTTQARGDELGALGLVGQNAQYGAGVNLGLAQNAQQLAQTQDAQRQARQAAALQAVGNLATTYFAPGAAVAKSVGGFGSGGFNGATAGTDIGMGDPTMTRQPSIDDIASALRAAGLI